jgi:hypothetical protein
MVLFLAIALLISPSTSFCRDENVYTLHHNQDVLENVGKEIYDFVAKLDDLKDGIKVRKQILLGITDIVSKYHSNEKLYITGRAVAVKATEGMISDILVIIHVFNSGTQGIDMVIINFNIQAVKDGKPIRMNDTRQKI